MNTYDFTCPICKEEHQFFTGRMTFGTPTEVLASEDLERPHRSIAIVNSKSVYIKGVVRIPVFDISDGYFLENWIRVTIDAWKKVANKEENLQGNLLYPIDLFQLHESMEWRVGYDKDSDEFLFFAKEDNQKILDWQINGMPMTELESYFARAIHAPSSAADESITTSSLDEAVHFVLTKDTDTFAQALLNHEIIFQLCDARGLELLEAESPGIGLDIPIDESVQDEFRDQILKFTKLSTYSSGVVNEIRLYQFNYGRDMDELRKDIKIIAEECYGVDFAEIIYQLSDVIKLQSKD